MSDGRTEHVCSRCGGTGRRALSGQRQRVLDAVRARGMASPCEVTDALDGVDSATTLNRAANVCAWLAREGFLRAVKRDGKRTVYEAVTQTEAVTVPPALAEALDSLRASMVTQPQAFALDHRSAWQYGIVVGWGDSLDAVAARHQWDAATVARLRRLRDAVAAEVGR